VTIIDGNKLFTISEVAKLTGVPTHTLRSWEKDFKEVLKPQRTVGGQRRYSWDNVEVVTKIKDLLTNKGLKPEAALRQLLQKPQTEIEMAEKILNSTDDSNSVDEEVNALADAIAEKIASRLKQKLSQVYKDIQRKTEL
jgi:DNA-binding transcriptional MerR regulator